VLAEAPKEQPWLTAAEILERSKMLADAGKITVTRSAVSTALHNFDCDGLAEVVRARQPFLYKYSRSGASASHSSHVCRQIVRDVIDKLQIDVVKSDDRGTEIQRPTGTLSSWRLLEIWRLVPGEGIGCDEIWLRPVKGASPYAAERGQIDDVPRGPFGSCGALEKALRAWRRGE
jgi:hypothetical protein